MANEPPPIMMIEVSIATSLEPLVILGASLSAAIARLLFANRSVKSSELNYQCGLAL